MVPKKASKDAVLKKLDASIRYCNSHRDPVQDIHDYIVDALINSFSRPNDYALRSHEMKSLFPVVTDPATHGFIPTIKMNQEELELDAHEFLV